MSTNNIKKIIKDRRVELGLTMLDVSKAVGVSEATVSRWESGSIENMKMDKIALLAKVLKLSPSVLMGWYETEGFLAVDFDNVINKTTTKYIPKYINFLKDVCEKLSIFSEKLTDDFFINKSHKIQSSISEHIDYKFYNDLLSNCLENVDKYNDSITIKDISNEITIKAPDEIFNLIVSIFTDTIEDIYNIANNIIIPDKNPSDDGFTITFNFGSNLDNDLIVSIYDNVENSETICDISNNISQIVEEELFRDIFNEVIITFIKQLNLPGKERILDYLKDLLSSDKYKTDK